MRIRLLQLYKQPKTSQLNQNNLYLEREELEKSSSFILFENLFKPRQLHPQPQSSALSNLQLVS